MFGWDDAAMLAVGVGSSLYGAKQQKKAARAAEAAAREAEARRVGYATETPEERASRATWNRVAQGYARGEMQPGEQASYDRATQIQKGRRGVEFNAARSGLADRLARYGQSMSPAGLAQMARIGENEQRTEEEANILEKAARQRDTEARVAQGFSMIGSDIDRGYRNRALLAGGAPGPDMSSAGYYGASAAGFGELGGEMIGRGLQGFSGSGTNQAAGATAGGAGMGGAVGPTGPQVPAGWNLGTSGWEQRPRQGYSSRGQVPWWRSTFGSGRLD